jgi:hypothetical protein
MHNRWPSKLLSIVKHMSRGGVIADAEATALTGGIAARRPGAGPASSPTE